LPPGDVTIDLHEKRLVSSAVLFHLTYMGQAIVKDLQHLKQVPPKDTGLAVALRLVPKDQAPEISEGRVLEVQRFFTADSDPSQEEAVLRARQTKGLVVEGPPGTGKSQTIVNMVGDAIGNHRSLLIICQKQPALDVVHKRLMKEGLGDRIAMISDVTRDRQPIIRAIREQIEQLSTRAINEAPAWKRRRESLAGRIEALERELNEHHAALHQADEQTGLTYRTLLGELVALDVGSRPPLEVPALRPVLAKETPSTVSALEEGCGPLSRQWLASNFEASALSVLKKFSPDPTSVELFSRALSEFSSAETARLATQSRCLDAFETKDPEAYAGWLDRHRVRFAALDHDDRAELARWSSLFGGPNADESPGAIALRDLAAMSVVLPKLDHAAHRSQTANVTVELSLDELRHFLGLFSIIGSVSFFSRLNPVRWLKNRRFNQFLTAKELDSGSPAQAFFIRACSLEIQHRPFRERLKEILTTLRLNTAIAPTVSPSTLLTVVDTVRATLGPVQALTACAREYPNRAEIMKTLREGTAESFMSFVGRIERSLELFQARAYSARC
jgi:hypothetical protein